MPPSKSLSSACSVAAQSVAVTATVPSAHQSQHAMNFLGLPVEIRNIVYHYLFREQTIAIKFPLSEYRLTGVLEVCRVTHQEATPILYNLVWFSITTEDLILPRGTRYSNTPQIRRASNKTVKNISLREANLASFVHRTRGGQKAIEYFSTLRNILVILEYNGNSVEGSLPSQRFCRHLNMLVCLSPAEKEDAIFRCVQSCCGYTIPIFQRKASMERLATTGYQSEYKITFAHSCTAIVSLEGVKILDYDYGDAEMWRTALTKVFGLSGDDDVSTIS